MKYTTLIVSTALKCTGYEQRQLAAYIMLCRKKTTEIFYDPVHAPKAAIKRNVFIIRTLIVILNVDQF